MGNLLSDIRADLEALETKARDMLETHLPAIRAAVDQVDADADSAAGQAIEGLVLTPAESAGVRKFLDHMSQEVNTAANDVNPPPVVPPVPDAPVSVTDASGATITETGQPIL